MEHTYIDKLLRDTLELVSENFPEAKRRLDAFNDAADHLEECEANGNLTRRASDARQRLNSPLLDMRPYQRAKKEVGKQCRKAKAKAEKAISEALIAYVASHQWQLEYDLLDDKDDATKHVPRSREDHSRDSKLSLAEPFIDELIARNVPPSAPARRRSFELDVIAHLIRSSHVDPDYKDPDNPWNQLAKAGILDAHREGMSEEEARLIDLAIKLPNQDAENLLAKAREFLPSEISVSAEFATGAALLMGQAGSLSQGEARAYADAFNLLLDKDIENCAKLLGIASESGLEKVTALVHFIRSQTWKMDAERPSWMSVAVLKKVYDRLKPDVNPPAEWVPALIEKLSQLAEIYAPRLDSEGAFYGIMNLAMHQSDAHKNFEDRANERDCLNRELSQLRYLEFAVRNHDTFKIDEFGFIIREEDSDYESREGKVYQVVSPWLEDDNIDDETVAGDTEPDAFYADPSATNHAVPATSEDTDEPLPADQDEEGLDLFTETSDHRDARDAGGDHGQGAQGSSKTDSLIIAPVCTDDDAGAALVDAAQTADDGSELAYNPGRHSGASENKFGSHEHSETTISPPADPLDFLGETNQNIIPDDETRRDDLLSSTREDDPPSSADQWRREVISAVHSDTTVTSTQKPDGERKGNLPRPMRLHPRQPSEIKDEDML